VRLIKQGELYSLDRRAGLDVQVEKCIAKFRVKHIKPPVYVCWNPGPFKDGHAGIEIPVDLSVPPGHLWLELEGKVDPA
jgi:hypothetical protein